MPYYVNTDHSELSFSPNAKTHTIMLKVYRAAHVYKPVQIATWISTGYGFVKWFQSCNAIGY